MKIEGINQQLKKNGRRKSEFREQILNLLEKNKPISADEILNNLSKKPNKTTIYREIDTLLEEGIISEINFNDGKKRYEIKGDHHHHIVCVNCKNIEEIKIKENMDRIEKDVENDTKYKLINHSLEFFGLCQKCK